MSNRQQAGGQWIGVHLGREGALAAAEERGADVELLRRRLAGGRPA